MTRLTIATLATRYAADDWHGGNLEYHFAVAAAMSRAGLIGSKATLNTMGSFPDLDMLNPYNNASTDPNFRAQMTLCASSSPLTVAPFHSTQCDLTSSSPPSVCTKSSSFYFGHTLHTV